MADIVNGGIIVLVAAFCLVAVVGGIDQLRDREATAAFPTGPDADPASQPTLPDAASALGKGALGEDRGDGPGEGRGSREGAHKGEGDGKDAKKDDAKRDEDRDDEEDRDEEDEEKDGEDEEKDEKDEKDEEEDGDGD
jgi:hypothetical protein